MSGALLSASAPIAAAGAPFAPTDIAGLVFWMNPDVGTFQTSGGAAAVADADPVGECQDQSGLANHAGQDISAKRPTLKLATQNSKNTLLYDGTDDGLFTSSVAHGIGTGDFWIVVAAKIGASGAYRTLFGIGAFNPAFYISTLKMNLYLGADNTFNTTLSVGTFYILEVMRTSGTLKGFLNGVQEANTFSSSTSVATAILIPGAENNGGGSCHNSNMGQELLYAASPSAGERTSLINYLGDYYGVTVNP